MISTETINKGLYKSLKELGCTEHEIKLYALSLKLGPSTIAKLAENLGISRPNVYKVIAGLEKKGLAEFSQKKNKTFTVNSPTVITDLIRQKKENLSSLDFEVTQLMPELLAQYRQGELPTSIRVLEGQEMFEKAFDSVLDEAKNEMQFFGSVKDFIGFISWGKEKDWIRRRVKKNLKMQSLLLPGEEAEELKKTDKKELRETRIITGITPFVTSFLLFGNKVIIWQPKAPLAILITDEYIARMLEGIFNVLWSNSK
jgi:sugar-specific transcriptional regulator TrmB